MRLGAALLAGTLFGLGLVVSGMAEPQNVLAFLTIGSQWNPSLIFVMGSGLLITAIGYALVTKRSTPIWGEHFRIPTNTSIDSRLLAGSALFGVGWGLSGYCPGPALVGAFLIDMRAVGFLASFVGGLLAYEVLITPKLQRSSRVSADG